MAGRGIKDVESPAWALNEHDKVRKLPMQYRGQRNVLEVFHFATDRASMDAEAGER